MELQNTTVENLSNNELTQFQREALADAEKELEKLKAENDGKKYLVDIEKDDIKLLSDFISKDASWKFTEALGIVEVEKEMKIALKEGKLFIKALAIEAIYYYMSKLEGSGNKPNGSAFPSITEYLRILKGISTAIERVKADNEKVREAEFVLAARMEGIEPDGVDA